MPKSSAAQDLNICRDRLFLRLEPVEAGLPPDLDHAALLQQLRRLLRRLPLANVVLASRTIRDPFEHREHLFLHQAFVRCDLWLWHSILACVRRQQSADSGDIGHVAIGQRYTVILKPQFIGKHILGGGESQPDDH
jgi:hypothetical protein